MKALLAALTAAALPFVGADAARELARNLAQPIADPEEKLEPVIDEALRARQVPRVGGWFLDATTVDVEALRQALIGSAEEIREVCGCFVRGQCPDCSERAA